MRDLRTQIDEKSLNRQQPIRNFYNAGLIFMLPFIFLDFVVAHAQRVDSLAPVNNPEVRRNDLFYKLAYDYIDNDNELGLYYAGRALRSAKFLHDSLRIVKSGRLKALAFRRLNRADSAINLASELLPIAVRNHFNEEAVQILNGLANAYSIKGFYDKALINYRKSLDLMQFPKDDSERSIALNNIGIIYYKLEDYDKALAYFLQSLKLKQETKSVTDMEILLVNISLCYMYKKEFVKAQLYVDKVTGWCGDNCSENVMMQKDHSSALILLGKGDPEKSEQKLINSYALAKKLNNEQFILDNINCLFQIFIASRRIDSALALVDEATAIIDSKTTYNPGLIQLYFNLFTLYSKTVNFKKVAYYQQCYIKLKNSIYNEDLTRNLMKVEAEYLERENRTKIEAQHRILGLNEEIIVRQKFVNAFIGVVAVLLVIVAVMLVRSNRIKRVANTMLEDKVKERTEELVISHGQLQRLLVERDTQVRKIASEIRSAAATIKGLSSLGMSDDDSGNRAQYVSKINGAAENLLKVIVQTSTGEPWIT